MRALLLVSVCVRRSMATLAAFHLSVFHLSFIFLCPSFPFCSYPLSILPILLHSIPLQFHPEIYSFHFLLPFLRSLTLLSFIPGSLVPLYSLFL